MKNSLAIRWTVAQILQIFYFQYCGLPPFLIFKMCKFSLPARFQSQYAYSCKMSCQSVERLRSYYELQILWRQSAILDLLYACVGPRYIFCGFCHCTKFDSNWFSIFDNIEVQWFLRFGWKLPIYAVLGSVFGVLNPLMGSIINRTSQKHILALKNAIWRIRRQNRANDLCASESEELTNAKKEKKKPIKDNFTYTCRDQKTMDRS